MREARSKPHRRPLIKALTAAAFALFLGVVPTSAQRVIDLATGDGDVALLGEMRGEAGRSLAGGDLDGDTTIDLAVGVPGSSGALGDRPGSGAVFVVFDLDGAPAEAPIEDVADFVLWGAEGDPDETPPFLGDNLGTGVLIADLDGDTVGDLVASAPRSEGPAARENAGVVVVVRGPLGPGSLDLATDPVDHLILGAGAGDCLGSGPLCFGSALAAGQLDGNQGAELLVGAPEADGEADGRTRSGEVYAISFTPPPPATLDLATDSVLAHVRGEADGDELGASLGLADLVGDDGLEDLVLGAPGADGPGDTRQDAGVVYVLDALLFPFPFPLDLGPGLADLVADGARAGDRAGSTVAALDWDGDGGLDLAVGAPGGDGPGPAFDRGGAGQVHLLYSPGPFPLVVDLATEVLQTRIFGAAQADNIGAALQGGAFVARQGESLLAGAPLHDGPSGGRSDAGALYVLGPRSSRPPFVDLRDDPADLVVHGAEGGARFSRSPVLGDVCGSGGVDLAAGSPLASGAGQDSGRADVLCDLVENTPPTAAVATPAVVGCAVGGTASVFLDGSPSVDFEGIAAWRWYEDAVDPGNLLATGETASVDLAVGIHALFLQVEDTAGLTDTAAFTVSVEETPGIIGNLLLTRQAAAPEALVFTWDASPCATTHRIFRGDLLALPDYDHSTPFLGQAGDPECAASSGIALMGEGAGSGGGERLYYLVGGVNEPQGTPEVGALGAADLIGSGREETPRPGPGEAQVVDTCP